MTQKSNQTFHKKLWLIALPITLQSIIQSALSLIDQYMVGQLGETAINAVGFGSKISFIFLLALAGIASATSIYAAQFWGTRDQRKMGSILGLTVGIGLLVSTVPILLSLLRPESIMQFFTHDSTVIKMGADYMRIIAPGLIPLVVIQALSAISRSCGDAKIPMMTGFFSVSLNTILNFMLIFGTPFNDAMGIQGAAYATTISRMAECILLFFLFSRKQYFPIRWHALRPANKALTLGFIATMLPLFLNETLWAIGDSIFMSLYGRLGSVQSAAMIATFPIQGLSFGLMSGLGAASGIIVGNLLGENQTNEAYSYGKQLMRTGVFCALGIGLLVIFLGPLYTRSLKISFASQAFARQILWVFGGFLWIKVSNMILAGGILRSGGHTKTILYLEMTGIWCIGVPIGTAAIAFTELTVPWIFFLISLEEVFRLGVGLFLFKRKKWMRNLNDERPASASPQLDTP